MVAQHTSIAGGGGSWSNNPFALMQLAPPNGVFCATFCFSSFYVFRTLHDLYDIVLKMPGYHLPTAPVGPGLESPLS